MDVNERNIYLSEAFLTASLDGKMQILQGKLEYEKWKKSTQSCINDDDDEDKFDDYEDYDCDKHNHKHKHKKKCPGRSCTCWSCCKPNDKPNLY